MHLIQTLSKKKEGLWIRDLSHALMLSILMGLFGAIAIPLPFSPVPLVLQSQIPLIYGLLFGARRAFLAVAFFLLEGAFGLPVFSQGHSGILWLLGPTGGYLVGYALAAYLVGWLAEREEALTRSKMFWVMGAGSVVIYACGAAYLSGFVGFEKSLLIGVAPFIIGDILKTIWASWGVFSLKSICLKMR